MILLIKNSKTEIKVGDNKIAIEDKYTLIQGKFKVNQILEYYNIDNLKIQENLDLIPLEQSRFHHIMSLQEAIIMKGKAEGDRIVTQALNARDEIRAEIEEQMHERVVEFAHKVFRKVLSADEQKLVHEGLLESVFQELIKVK